MAGRAIPTTVASIPASADPRTVPSSTHRPGPLEYLSQAWPPDVTAGAPTVLPSHPFSAPSPVSGSGVALRGEREREQRVGRVVDGRLDRRPADDVVLVRRRLRVEQPVAAGAAGPHAADGAQPDEVIGAARAVDGRAELHVAAAGRRAGQVGDLALHAPRERGARPDHERAAPRVGAEREAELLVGEGLVEIGPAVAPVQRVGDVEPERVRRGIAGAKPGAEPEGIVLGPVLAEP